MLINNQKHLQVGGRIRTLPLVMCQEPVWVPKVIQTSAPDLKVTPAVEEMVRLEGHYWAKSWAKGRKIEIGFAGFSKKIFEHLSFTFNLYFVHHIQTYYSYNYAHTCFSRMSFSFVNQTPIITYKKQNPLIGLACGSCVGRAFEWPEVQGDPQDVAVCIALIDSDAEEKAFWSLIFVLWKSHSPALASTLAEWLGSRSQSFCVCGFGGSSLHIDKLSVFSYMGGPSVWVSQHMTCLVSPHSSNNNQSLGTAGCILAAWRLIEASSICESLQKDAGHGAVSRKQSLHGTGILPETVTTNYRKFSSLVADPYKPSFSTERGSIPSYTPLLCRHINIRSVFMMC